MANQYLNVKTDNINVNVPTKETFDKFTIKDLGLVSGDLLKESFNSALIDVKTPGIYKFQIKSNINETVEGTLIVSQNLTATDKVTQFLVVGYTAYIRFLTNSESTRWNNIMNDNSSGVIKICYINNDISGSGFVYGVNDKVYTTVDDISENFCWVKFDTIDGNSNNNIFSVGDHIYLLKLNDTQICIDNSCNIYYRTSSNGFNNVPWILKNSSSSSSKKYSTIVIGNSASGLTANDVDYLYMSDSNFSTTLTNAINALPSTGGEIKILSGTYTFTSNCRIFGSSNKLIKITGEGSCTKFTGTGNCLLKYCEISNIQLNNKLNIKVPGGHVNIHDCEFNLTSGITSIEVSSSSTSLSNISSITIKNNLLTSLSNESESSDFIKLTGNIHVSEFKIIGNYINISSGKIIITCAVDSMDNCHIMNNDISNGEININISKIPMDQYNKIFGNNIGDINISDGNAWEIRNNSIKQINIYSGHDQGKIINNKIDNVSSIGLAIKSTFVGNVILNTNFDTAKIPGFNDQSNKWGNNMWADGKFDRMVLIYNN